MLNVQVRAVVVQRYRFDMVNARSGDKVGTMSTRPHETEAMNSDERRKRVQLFCDLANSLQGQFRFEPEGGTNGAP